ncbi:MAG: Gfo/Idh/MocA family oxidoreductase [Clostridia bacterium]|nr:Gfo/Idh/MocA family oxidoreductase [Clostridia bacterium]
MDIVRVGIIGVGNMGSSHAKRIVAGEIEGMTLAAIADTNPARLEWAKENCPGAELFSDAIEMMDSGKVDAVIVATPHYDHPVLVTEALKRDIHALCEKPAGVYTQAVREVNELASRSKATYAIMFNQRTNCVYRKMKEIVESGTMGRIRRTNWLITNWYRSQSYYDSGAWRATWSGEGGGVLLNQCPHNLDLWQWICGMPVKVRAFMAEGKWHDIEVEDDVTAYVEYANGATGVFITSTGDTPGTNRFEIIMDGGKLVCEKDELWLYKNKMSEPEFSRTWTKGFGEPGYDLIKVETDGFNPQHAGVLRAFAAHILHGEPLVASGVEGINGLTLSNAMHLSAWTDSTIELPMDEAKFLEELNKRRASSRRKEGEGVVLNTENTYNA